MSRKRSEQKDATDVAGPGPRSTAALVVLGVVSCLWSLFLWAELVVMRSGGSTFCGFGGRFDCNAVWSGSFASFVHGATGLPLAGWGLVWSLVAASLPLAMLVRLAEGRLAGSLLSATRVTAGAGVLAVVVFVVESVLAGAVCVGCIGTYLLVLAYGAVALWSWRSFAFPSRERGSLVAGGATAAAFAVLLYPGLHTPKSSGEAGRRVVTEAAGRSASSASTGTGDLRRDKALEDLVASLDPAMKQTLSDSLNIYRTSPERQLPPPRALVGSDLARIRITDFTDILCEHCADLHQTLEELGRSAAPGSFNVDSRQFPLDGRCNPVFEPRSGDDVHCVAAKARICMEPTGRGEQFAAALFAKQKGLTAKQVLDVGATFMPRAQLTACLDAAATRQKLDQDIAAASSFDTDGTPLVVLNGKRGTSFPAFLYAMILTKGSPDHPAFDTLPPPNPAAHLH